MQKLITYTIVFLLLSVLQSFVISHLAFSQYLNIYIYIMVIIIADTQIKGYVLLLLAFVLGIITDSIEGSPGLFTITMTFMAFCRPQILSIIASREILDNGGMPTSSRFGTGRFITYVTIMVSFWAIPFFLFETAGIANIFLTLLRIVLNVISTTILIYFLQLPLNRSKYDI